jgi:small-conductance mechanosensitive channel
MPSILRRSKYIAAAIGLALALSGAALAQVPTVIEGRDVLPYLNQVIDWQRRLSILEVPAELPRVLLIRNSLHDHTAKAVAAAFNAAHAIAATLPAQSPDTSVTDDSTQPKSGGIEKAIHKATTEVHDLQAALDKADGAHRQSLDGQLKLAQEHLTLIKTIATAIGNQSDDNDTLDEQIEKLSDTVPEADGGSGKQTAAPPVASAAASTTEGGMAGVLGDLYGYMKEKQEIKTLRNETQAMLEESRGRSRALRDTVQSLMKQGADIAKTAPAQKAPAKHAGARKAAPAPVATPAAAPVAPAPTYDDLLSDMKQISTIAVPLSQLNLALDASSRDLGQWSDALSQQIHTIARRLGWRLGVMGSTILCLFALSGLFSRATRRYVLDERRQVQLRTFRKLVLICSIATIIFLGFFTDFTSLATFAGLITAGLAVALQTVILSVVAFFHFFGSFGIRVGDRITISGVTGRVMQIGMVRFYLMEVERSEVGFIPTGRVVGFPNSILFQPTPFFHQVPGTNFVWTEINLTLDPSVDHTAAFKKIHDTVTRVYASQRSSIELQQTALNHFTRFKAQMAEPQIYTRITGSGLVMTIRYAVQREQETDLHLKMTEELLSVIKKDPQLKFVGVG